MNTWVWDDVPGLNPRLNALYRQSWAILGAIEHEPDDSVRHALWEELGIIDHRIANVRETEGL